MTVYFDPHLKALCKAAVVIVSPHLDALQAAETKAKATAEPSEGASKSVMSDDFAGLTVVPPPQESPATNDERHDTLARARALAHKLKASECRSY